MSGRGCCSTYRGDVPLHNSAYEFSTIRHKIQRLQLIAIEIINFLVLKDILELFFTY